MADNYDNGKRFFLLLFILLIPKLMFCQSAYIFLAKTYAEEGKLQEAELYESKALEMIEASFDKTSYEYAKNLNDLAEYYAFTHNYPRAIECTIKISQIIEHSIGKENESYVNSLYFLAKYYSYSGNREKAIDLCNEANELLHSFFADNPKYLTTLSQVAKFYSDLNAYSEGINLNIELLELIRAQLGEDHPYYASCLSNIAVDYLYLGELGKAKDYETMALNLRGKIFGRKHRDYAISLDILAMCYSRLGDNENAIKLGEESKDILNQILCDRDIDYSKCLSNLAEYYGEIGDYATAIDYNKKAYDIIIELGVQDPQDKIDLLQNLSKYYIHSGEYEEGIKLGYEVIDILKLSFGTNNRNYATLLGNISMAYFELGNYDTSISLTKEALQVMENIVGKHHVDCATLLHLLSSYYYAKGELMAAIEAEKTAMANRKNVLGDSHPYYATSLGTLSNYYLDMGDWDTALSYNESAMNVLKQTLGETHKDYATILNNRSIIYASLGYLDNALNLTNKAINIIKKYIGVDHAKYTTYLLWATNLYDEIGDYKNLERSIIEVDSIINKEINSTFSYLSYNERRNYWESRGSWLQYHLPYYLFNSTLKSLNGIAYNAILLSKGILLNSELEFDRFVMESSSEDLQRKYYSIRSIKHQMKKYLDNQPSWNNCKIDSLAQVANKLERELMHECKEFGDYTKNLSITWNEVKNHLGKNAAAIEFVSFPINDDRIMYMAYVLRDGYEVPQIITLYDETEIINHIDKNDPQNIYTDYSFSRLIWGKLTPYLEGIDTIYFAPDGILHQIAIENLSDSEKESRMSDRYHFYRLSSTREIVDNNPSVFNNSAVVYGGIKYDTDPATMEENSQKYDQMKTRGFDTYYNLGDSITLRGSLEYLDGSLIEAENIDGMMKEKEFNSIFLSGNDATEESFKNFSGQVNGIIHISTHGFYWSEEKAERKAQLNNRLMFMSTFGEDARRSVEDKALTRTGLFMAGARNALAGIELPEGVDDGILTAQEIAALDLRGTDLVVLSACQTGMGDISGDGVFGLQRGFKKAGANTILMSLWDVNDEATQILMTEFYKNFLNGKSKRESLLAAQKVVRETPGFEDPEYWASFILLDALN